MTRLSKLVIAFAFLGVIAASPTAMAASAAEIDVRVKETIEEFNDGEVLGVDGRAPFRGREFGENRR